MLPSATRLLPFTLLVVSCQGLAGDDPGGCEEGKCDVVEEGCHDPRYGDGQCQLDLSCEAPDLDCFRTFEDDASARLWYRGVLDARGLSSTVLSGEDDPRYRRMRDLLDRGWTAYQQSIPVADLGRHRPALLLMQDAMVNAFVVPDENRERVPFAVLVHTGLVDSVRSDDAALGVVMHELQHAVGLHILPGRKQHFQRYYRVAAGQPEPFGFQQANDPQVEQVMTAILYMLGPQVGIYPAPEWNGVPCLGSMLYGVLRAAQADGAGRDPAACQGSGLALDRLDSFARAHFHTLDSALVIGGDGGELSALTQEVVIALRAQCLAGSTATLWDYLARREGSTPEEEREAWGPDDQALADGKHVVDAVVAVTKNRFQIYDEIGDRSGLRYYSVEEIADDVTVDVLRKAGLSPTGMADFLDITLPEGDRTPCRALLDAGEMPPYGQDLLDDHHATCWRTWHIRRLAEANVRPRAADIRAP